MADRPRGRRFKALRMRKLAEPPPAPDNDDEVIVYVNADGRLMTVRRFPPEEG